MTVLCRDNGHFFADFDSIMNHPAVLSELRFFSGLTVQKSYPQPNENFEGRS